MAIHNQLKLLKEKRRLTNQQLSDLSGVPIGTVNRILSGQTDNPSFQAVCDMVMAMDGSLDELVGIKEETPSSERKSASKEIIQLYEGIIADKEKWMMRLFTCCCILTLVLIGIVAFDLLNPHIGFFQS
ncbi:MAG: helix-turn-helix domain-containing protein [Ruminiclostridium sp.]|nr:helix-turn-helix domain-containing protein [Ruminiclostridium sp.]